MQRALEYESRKRSKQDSVGIQRERISSSAANHHKVCFSRIASKITLE